jgi:hypothetical protein
LISGSEIVVQVLCDQLTVFVIVCSNSVSNLLKGCALHFQSRKARQKERRGSRTQRQVFGAANVAFWVDPETNDYLWKTWIEEILLISELAIV